MEEALVIFGSLTVLYFIGFGIVLLIGWLLRKIVSLRQCGIDSAVRADWYGWR